MPLQQNQISIATASAVLGSGGTANDSVVSEGEKSFWKGHTERRRERGMRLKQIKFFAEASQVKGFFSLFEDWVLRWGKETATDLVIASMCDAEARYQDWLEFKRNAHA